MSLVVLAGDNEGKVQSPCDGALVLPAMNITSTLSPVCSQHKDCGVGMGILEIHETDGLFWGEDERVENMLLTFYNRPC